MNDTAPHRVVVIGGGYAGLTTAARIGEQNSELDLTLIDANPNLSNASGCTKLQPAATPDICLMRNS